MRRIYHARQRIITTTSLQHRRTNGGAARLAVVPLKKRKNRIRRKVKLAPDLQHAGACLYNNFLAPPAHNGSSARLRLFRRKTEEPHTTESKTCAGLTARGSVLVQQLPCSAGAQRKLCKIAVVPLKKRKTRIRRKIKYAPDCRGAPGAFRKPKGLKE